MSGLGTFRRRPPPAPVPGPAVLGYAPAKVEGQRVILASCDVTDREDAERDLAEWRKRSDLWQLVEVRLMPP